MNRDRSGQLARAEEDDLFRRIRSGDVTALDLFLERQWSPLVAYLETFVGPDEAEDMAQEAVVRLWERRMDWTPTGSLRALAYSIARNLALNEVRRRQIQSRRWSTRPPDPPAPLPSPSDSAHAAQLRAAIDAALETLPARRREILILSRFHEPSHDEIAFTASRDTTLGFPAPPAAFPAPRDALNRRRARNPGRLRASLDRAMDVPQIANGLGAGQPLCSSRRD